MTSLSEIKLPVWGGRITARVKQAGCGSALIFLHDGYGPAWNEFLDLLAGHFTVYALEHPGTSAEEPDAIRQLHDLWELTLFYDEVLEGLGLSAAPLVGHSFGGMVAAELAAAFPKRISRLVLIDALGLWLDEHPVRNYMISPPQELARMFFANRDHPACQRLLAGYTDKDATLVRMWALGCTGKFIWPLPDKGLRRRIHRIKAPTLILWGQHDSLTPVVYADEFARLIPGAQTRLIQDAAHMAPLEQPQAVARAVGEFLQP